MTERFQGEAISWEVSGGVIELALHRGPCNEIGSLSLQELEHFTESLEGLCRQCHALIIHSAMPSGFCAGADMEATFKSRIEGVVEFAFKCGVDLIDQLECLLQLEPGANRLHS